MPFDQLERRNFMMLVGYAAAWPLSAVAQPSSKRPTIGFIGPSTPSAASDRTAAFEERLNERGWTSGRTVTINYQWSPDGDPNRFREIASRLVQDQVDVIVTWGTATALAAKATTSTIPIVFTIVSDPVGSGLVTSLARPDSNVTGFSTLQVDVAGKRLEMLRELIPQFTQLAILANANNPGTLREIDEATSAAKPLGLEVVTLTVRTPDELADAIHTARRRAEALFVASDAFLNNNRDHINKLAIEARLPTVYGYRGPTQSGGLISYGPNYADLFRRAADYVDKILRGTKPADLPIQQPTSFELIINLKTAKTLGINIPPGLLARADEVIE